MITHIWKGKAANRLLGVRMANNPMDNRGYNNNYNGNNGYNGNNNNNGYNGNNNNYNGNNNPNNNPNNNRNDKNNQNGNKPPKYKQTIIIVIIAAIVTMIASSIMSSILESETTKEISYNKFLKKIEDKEIKKIKFTEGKIIITPKDSDNSNLFTKKTYWTAQLNDEQLIPLLKQSDITYKGEVTDKQSSIMTFLIEWILPFGFISLIMTLLFRKVGKSSGMMGVGKSNAKVYVEKETGVTFVDVAGQEEARESLTEIVDFLHNPGKYASIGAKLPKGALLVGPPGTGKTLLAKAVAGEAKVPFFSLSGSDFVEMFVGVGASRVRDLFKEATKMAPCIIFIDEIDAIGKSRDSRYGGGNDEREQTLNQLLSEMDGFDASKGILILAATNRPEVLDKALLRPGRFDRRIIVDRPDLKGRLETLKVHSKDVLMDDTVDLDALALATAGLVGSDLANMVNEAAINAVKAGRETVSQKDLLEAIEVVMMGKEKKDRVMSAEEKKIVSYHEIGHALASALQKNTDPIQKITIVPRTMGALGYVMNVPEEEKYLNSEAELRAMLVSMVAGRASEEINFGSVTTGASNDIEQATNIARSMITQYGMSEKFGLVKLESVEDRYLSGRTVMDCSDLTAAEIDKEVMKLMSECYDEAKRLLSENKELVDELATFLLEKESITGKEFMEIFNRAKGITPD